MNENLDLFGYGVFSSVVCPSLIKGKDKIVLPTHLTSVEDSVPFGTLASEFGSLESHINHWYNPLPPVNSWICGDTTDLDFTLSSFFFFFSEL